MKKILITLVNLLLIAQANAQFPAPYCAERFLTTYNITRVTFSNINNTVPDSLP